MHSVTFVAVALALVMATSAQSFDDLPHNDFYLATNKCIANQAFIDKCNTCFCGPEGKDAACTMMDCLTPEKSHIDGFQTSKDLFCPPGEKFYDGCNACTCDESGETAICNPTADCNVHARSSRSAPAAEPYLPHIDNFHETNECTPNQSFQHQCNTCHCAADGKSAACTLRACYPNDKIRIDNFTKGMKCPANKTFYDQCNICMCGADGASGSCTIMLCIGYE